MRIRQDQDSSFEVQMGPLMDLVFLLLIFFIVIAVTKKSIKQLGIELPPPGAAVSSIKPRDKDLLIRVTAEGQIWVGDEQVGQQGLLDSIAATARADPKTRVRFELDRRARVEHLMPVWDQLSFYGLTNWSIRTTMQ